MDSQPTDQTLWRTDSALPISARAARRACVAGHAAADFFFDGGVEEGLQLGLDFGVAAVAAEEGADSTDHVSEHGDLFS